MQRETIKRLVWILIIVVSLSVVWSVWRGGTSPGISSITQSSDEELAIALLLDVADIELLWVPTRIVTDWKPVSNGTGASRWFGQSSSRPWVNVSEDVVVFPSTELAIQYYDAEVLDLSRVDLQGWDSMPMLRFSQHADDSHVACQEAYVNEHHHYGCFVIMRYKRAIGIISGNIFDTQWVTAEQFRQVLIAADNRFLENMELLER